MSALPPETVMQAIAKGELKTESPKGTFTKFHKLGLGIISGLVFVAAVTAYLIYASYHETADDAYTTGNIHNISSRVAGTVVVREVPLQGIVPASHAASADPGMAGDPRKISNEELRLIEAFLDRRAALDPVVRRNMAHQIAVRMGKQLEVPLENRPDAEKFLEALAEAKRSISRYS